MDNIIKIQPQQSGFVSRSKKQLADFILPAGPNYDLSRSYVSVELEPSASYTNAPAVAGITPVCNQFFVFEGAGTNAANQNTGLGNNVKYPSNAVLVKNASAFATKVGKAEDLRNVDVLKTNLGVFSRNTQELENDIVDLSGFDEKTQFHEGVEDRVKLGNEPSRVRTREVRIPLSSIFNHAKTDNFNTNKYGELRYHLELNFDKLNVDQYDTDVTTRKQYNVAGAEYSKMVNTGALAADTAILITNNTYENICESPWAIGQTVKVTSNKDGAGAAPNAGFNTIINIEKNTAAAGGGAGAGDNERLVLTLDGNWTNGAGTYTEVAISTLDATDGNADLSGLVKNVELTAVVNNEPATNAPLVYTTYLAQEDSYPASARIQRNYEIPANCKNVYVMFNTYTVSRDTLDTYRVTIDNEEITNRAVQVNSPLHFDLLQQTFMNAGDSIHSIMSKILRINADEVKPGGANNEGHEIKIIAFPVPFKPVSQRLNLELEAAAAATLLGQHVIFSEVVRKI